MESGSGWLVAGLSVDLIACRRRHCHPTLQVPMSFNRWNENEDMIVLHLETLRRQLQQAYVGMALATAAARPFILPKVRRAPQVQLAGQRPGLPRACLAAVPGCCAVCILGYGSPRTLMLAPPCPRMSQPHTPGWVSPDTDAARSQTACYGRPCCTVGKIVQWFGFPLTSLPAFDPPSSSSASARRLGMARCAAACLMPRTSPSLSHGALARLSLAPPCC